ncbi:hypothetical protein [Rhodanobacter sp. PCA2]|uniref:hypothetical protein n=1 Tax=Rhodanobacter sp. PCA2 TaxID=2006117 RepID=UPI0015E788A3|nr:hypothetical protein [Rhodanobacter sp. PCA2]MBA2079164.1 hypothetical protein [Rhodanobacter sp. PCA2]
MPEFNGIVISEKFYVLGGAAFIRAVAEPLDDEVQELRRQYLARGVSDGWDMDEEENLPAPAPLLFAALTDLEGLYTAVATVSGGYVTKKIFDEVWDITLRPKLRKALGALFAKKNAKKYGVSILFRDKRSGVSILVVSVGETLQAIEQGDRQARLVIERSVKTLNELPSKGTSAAFGAVHMYVVEESKANELPLIYNSVQEAMLELRGMFPARHPQVVSRLGAPQQSP